MSEILPGSRYSKLGKYSLGHPVKSLDELMNLDYVYSTRAKKLFHKGWFQSWPLHLCMVYIRSAALYTIEPIPNLWK